MAWATKTGHQYTQFKVLSALTRTQAINGGPFDPTMTMNPPLRQSNKGIG
jgi:hypothetical protein